MRTLERTAVAKVTYNGIKHAMPEPNRVSYYHGIQVLRGKGPCLNPCMFDFAQDLDHFTSQRPRSMIPAKQQHMWSRTVPRVLHYFDGDVSLAAEHITVHRHITFCTACSDLTVQHCQSYFWISADRSSLDSCLFSEASQIKWPLPQLQPKPLNP